MKPGFVSYRLIRPVIPKSLLIKLNCGLIPRKESICSSGSGRFVPVRVLLSGTPISHQIKDRFSRTKLQSAGVTRNQNPKVSVLVTAPSSVDLSEAEPHGFVLFQIRSKSFFPKRDEFQLFNPGEQSFISRLMGTFS
jgi:hypothetical protein